MCGSSYVEEYGELKMDLFVDFMDVKKVFDWMMDKD